MSNIARLQAHGEVLVPQEIREACGLAPGDDLIFVKTGDKSFECQILPRSGTLLEYLDRHAIPHRVIDIERLREEAAAEEGESIVRWCGQ